VTLLRHGSWSEAWRWLTDGASPGPTGSHPCGHDFAVDVRQALAREARLVDVAALWQTHLAAEVQVLLSGSSSYPAALADGPHAPAGPVRRRRRCDLDRGAGGAGGHRGHPRLAHGQDATTAFELGRDLSRAGVSIVSGLALGIDGAAHAGALDAPGAPPVGVVGSGLDVVYPARNAPLWRAVGRAGALVSEHPLGVRPRPWHFLARNRIIAPCPRWWWSSSRTSEVALCRPLSAPTNSAGR